MSFCFQCGAPLGQGLRFCTKCGAAVSPGGSAPPATPSETPGPVSAPQAFQPLPQAPPPSSQYTPVPPPPQPVTSASASTSRGCMPTVLVVLGVLVLIAVLGIGGLVYAGYKIKQKATAFLHSASPDATSQPTGSHPDSKPGSPAASPEDEATGILNGLGKLLGGANDNGDPVDSISDSAPVDPCPTAAYPSQSAARIPLQPGTVITTAWGMKNGDVETRDTISSTTPVSFVTDSSTEAYKDDNGRAWKPITIRDTVCNADLESANTYVTVTSTRMPHLIHGITRLRLSDKSFAEARNSGKTSVRYFDITDKGQGVKPNYEEGLLTRVEPGDVPYPMIVNDQRVNLPAIHLAGIMDINGKDPRPKAERPSHTAADFYVVDDPLNPLVLLMKLKDPVLHAGNFRIEVVKIDFKTSSPVNTVEKQLTEQKRAITYGIYFDFNKDTIKPESEPVLKQIVQAMTDNPDWKLTVSGHTDNIGGDAYNLDLSRRRAAAVKQELVTRYHISADRLTTDGFGASRPIDTNDTLGGRARNRRVELTRE